jgi:hypothetical protein
MSAGACARLLHARRVNGCPAGADPMVDLAGIAEIIRLAFPDATEASEEVTGERVVVRGHVKVLACGQEKSPLVAM